MIIDLRVVIGSAGVPPHDYEQAYRSEKRLHWLMLLVSLLSMPTHYLEEIAVSPLLHRVGLWVDAMIVAAFTCELLWMLYVTRQKSLYLLHNWLDLMIIAGSAASFAGAGTEWVALARILRLAVIGMMLLRLMSSVRRLFSPDGLPYILAFGVVTMLLGGASFYLLEPTVLSVGEGIWLAFTTAATVGYGDLVPTTLTSRVFAVVLVVVGYSMFGAVTASIAAIFIGEDEKRLRREMHRDIQALRADVSLLRDDIRRISQQLNRDEGHGAALTSDSTTRQKD